MKAYANSNWPKHGQNNYNHYRAIKITPKSLPIDRILKILKENKDKE